MADRNLDFDPTVTAVTPKLPDDSLPTGAANIGEQVATMSANAKALNATTQTALAFRQADAQFRQDAASNPQDPEALAKLQSTRAQITSQMGQQVPAIASREYMSHVMEVQQNSDKLNELWGMQQSVKNAHADLTVNEMTQYKIAGDAGRQFASDDGNFANLDSVLGFEQAQQAISKFAGPVLGESQTTAYLKNFNANYVKSFVSAIAETNPAMAATALQQDNIKTHFTPEEIDDMGALIKKTQKTQELLQSYTITKNDGGLMDVVNDPNSGYAEKSNQIYRGIADGSISSKAGNTAIKILHSQDVVDAQTDAPTMKSIVDRVNDLNANSKLDSDGYLKGVRDMHNQILQESAQGNLTQNDAQKLSKQVDGLMKTRTESATNQAGMEMYAATKQFDALPLEYRAQATRSLFYNMVDNNLNPSKDKAQLSNAATQIIQQVNNQRRQNAQQTINGVVNDSDFVKSSGYTMDDVNETAKNRGISADEVILRMRANVGTKARAKQTAVKSIKGGGSESSDEGSAAPARETPPSDSQDDNEIEREMEQ